MSTAIVRPANTMTAALTAEYVNPLIMSTREVFEMMLDCVPVRTGLRLKSTGESFAEVSAVIGISGGPGDSRVVGTVVVGMSASTACQILERMIGEVTAEVNSAVCDAIGEITNMVAGAAKSRLAEHHLQISLPNVVTGEGLQTHFPSSVQPMVLEFNSDLGAFTIEVGFSETRIST